MLHPESRAVLTEQLRPPSGYTLGHAVATTFTLDLETALVVPLSFAARQLAEAKDPLSILESVRSCADRVDIFAQAGNVIVPPKASDLMAFLEPMVHVVRRPRPGRLFHPKTWFLKFESGDGDVLYRLLVLSRNLTADRSWDTCLSLDGTPGRISASNRPLSELLKALPPMTTSALSGQRRQRVNALAAEIRGVVWVRPDDVSNVLFHVMGLPSSGSFPSFKGTSHLVISPFCNEQGLATLLPVTSQSRTLVSRQETFDALSTERTDQARCLVLDPTVGLTEGDIDTGELSGLHAKIFLVEHGHRARVFVGSANATDAAFGGNVEILVEMEGSKTKIGILAILGVDSGSLLSVLQDYGRQVPDAEDDGQWALENALRDLAVVPLRVKAIPAGDAFDWQLSSDATLRVPSGLSATAAPLTRQELAQPLRQGRGVQTVVSGLALTDVTPFVMLVATDGERFARTVVPARLEGDPPGRLDEILAKQIQTPEDFVRFLKLLLRLVGEDGVSRDAQREGGMPWSRSSQGIFEILVRAMADQPKALDDLQGFVKRMLATDSGRAKLPVGFDALWAVVTEARRPKRRRL